MESWRLVWRNGFAPHLTDAELLALHEALATDDPRLTQGSTTTPPPLMCVQDWPVEAGCVLGFCGAVANGGFGTATVGEAKEFFDRACSQAGQSIGEPAACRWFLNYWDDTPRKQMFQELLEEVGLELGRRRALETA